MCLVLFLQKHEKNGLAWSMLASSYFALNSKSQSKYCFFHGSQLLGAYSSFIKHWHFIGPFPIGKSEFDGDPINAFNGIANISKYRYESPVPSYFSELSPEGRVSWNKISQAKADEFISINPQVNWNDLVSSLSSMGMTEWQGWLVGDFVVNQVDLSIAFQCLGVAKCIIGNKIITGDFYHRKDFWSTVSLPQGIHPIFIPVRSKAGTRIKFSVIQSKRFNLIKPSFLPDLYDGFLPKNSHVSIPVSNLMPFKWLKINTISINDYSGPGDLKVSLLNKKNYIAPGQTMPLIIKIESEEIENGEKLISSCVDSQLRIVVKTSEGSKEMSLDVRCRTRRSSFLFTFLDHDGSVQHAAAIEPLGSCPLNDCPVILTLHGTTVPPQNQADSYKQMVNGAYQFGVKNMWLLAPTR